MYVQLFHQSSILVWKYSPNISCDCLFFFSSHSKSNTKLGKIFHAKLVVVDRTTALVGSANISKGALVSNYEIMLKISGDAVSSLSLMLDNLVEILEKESDEAWL